MKKLFVLLASLLLPAFAVADISVPFSDNFDGYSEGTALTTPYPSPWYSGLPADGCSATTITSSASYGSSGKGIRYLIGNGKNKNSSSFVYLLSSPTNEIWARFYKRYASGFTWQGGAPSEEKVFWFSDTSNTDAIIYEHSRDQCWEGSSVSTDAIHFWLQNSAVNEVVCAASNTGWVATQGGSIGDGKWHAYEVHIKKGTNATSKDGVLQVWVDGSLRLNRSNIATGNGWPRNQLHFQVNQDAGGNTPCAPVDFDNLVVYTSTPPSVDASGNPFIGLVGSSTAPDTTPPVVSGGSPSGTLSAGTSSAVLSVTTNESATCKYSDTSGVSYASMPNTFSTTGGTSHGTTLSSLTSGTSYTKYVRCIDNSGNADTSDYTVSFSIASPSSSGSVTPGNLIFSESFDSAINQTNGWVDGSLLAIDSNGYNGPCAKLSWAAGAQQPTNITTIRRDLGAGRNQLYVEFYVKFDTGWRGSAQNYHPHIMWIRGNDDYTAGIWDGPAYAYQNNYIEFQSDTTSPYNVRPVWFVQDGKRVNTSYGTPPIDISGQTETRSVGKCNGIKSGAYQGTYNDCYNISGSQWWSQLGWKSSDTAIPFGTWKKVAYAIKLNSVSNGIGNADGEVRVWIDGTEIMHQTNVIIRPGSDSDDSLRQFAIAPYIGDGAPVAETMYIDELRVYDGYSISGSSSTTFGIGTVLIPQVN